MTTPAERAELMRLAEDARSKHSTGAKMGLMAACKPALIADLLREYAEMEAKLALCQVTLPGASWEARLAALEARNERLTKALTTIGETADHVRVLDIRDFARAALSEPGGDR